MSLIFVPPLRFDTVEPSLYRGAYPTLKNFTFLLRLKLKSIISIIPEPPNRDLQEFCSNEKIKNFHIFTDQYHEGKITPKRILSEVLQLIINHDLHPMFIHCLDGGHITGLVIMCLRKLQNWSLPVIATQFCWLNRDSSISLMEYNYISSFNVEIVLRKHIPSWLWQGQRITHHPSFLIQDNFSTSTSISPKPLKQNSSDSNLDKSFTEELIPLSLFNYDNLMVSSKVGPLSAMLSSKIFDINVSIDNDSRLLLALALEGFTIEPIMSISANIKHSLSAYSQKKVPTPVSTNAVLEEVKGLRYSNIDLNRHEEWGTE